MRMPSPTLALSVLVAVPAAAQMPANFAPRARTGAPAAISANATVAHIDAAGKQVHTVQQGTNGFTCTLLPDGTDAPVCADAAGWQWVIDAFLGKPAPTNTVPGIAYMAAGGKHHEMPDGTMMMAPSAQTKEVDEPPHWMVLWAFDPAKTGLPARVTPAGAYIMFHGTPYAHVMVYQNPATFVK